MKSIQFVLLGLAIGAVFLPPAVSAQDSSPKAPPAAQAAPLDGLETLNGVVVLGSYDHFSPHGVTNKMENTVVVDGPGFLRRQEARVKAALQPYLGKPLSQAELKLMQRDLIMLCRKLDRPWVDAFYPQQEIQNHVAQIMVYEGRLGKVSAVYWPFNHPGTKWYSEKFITNSIHLKPGDPISQKKLVADLDHLNAAAPQFLEANLDVKQGRFKQDGSASTDIDVLVKDRFPLRVFTAYDDYGVKTLGENRLSIGLNYANLWGLAHQFNYLYTTDWDFDHLRSHNASYVAPFSWGHSLTLFGGYTDLNADLSKVLPSALLRSSGKVYQISARYTMPMPKLGKLDQIVALGYDFKYANTPLEFDEEALSSFHAAVDQFVLNYHAHLPDALGSTDLSASGNYSPGSLAGPNTTTDFRTLAPDNAPDLKADYYYGRLSAERDFALPWNSLLKLLGGYQASSGRLLPSEQMYLGGDQLLRGYPENVVAGDAGWNATAELHTPIIRTGNITRQENLPGVNGDTVEIFGFYDYGSVRPSGSDAGTYRYSLQSAGAGLNLHISQNLVVNFAYGFELNPLHVSAGSISPAQAQGRSRALVSATLSF
jgi:hemolysin activation/secretion protein